MQYVSYPIQRTDEEGDCLQCGCPLDIGDTAQWIELPSNAGPFCGDHCRKSHKPLTPIIPLPTFLNV